MKAIITMLVMALSLSAMATSEIDLLKAENRNLRDHIRRLSAQIKRMQQNQSTNTQVNRVNNNIRTTTQNNTSQGNNEKNKQMIDEIKKLEKQSSAIRAKMNKISRSVLYDKSEKKQMLEDFRKDLYSIERKIEWRKKLMYTNTYTQGTRRF